MAGIRHAWATPLTDTMKASMKALLLTITLVGVAIADANSIVMEEQQLLSFVGKAVIQQKQAWMDEAKDTFEQFFGIAAGGSVNHLFLYFLPSIY